MRYFWNSIVRSQTTPFYTWVRDLNSQLTKIDTQMENNHMKRHSPLHVVQEIQIKTQWGNTSHLLEWPKSSIDYTKCWQRYGTRRIVIYCWWECKMLQPLWQTIWQFLTKLNLLIPYNQPVVLFVIYPKELKTYVHTKSCT
jgi:hypothetical protein